MYFESYSERAKRAVFFARALAKQAACQAIEPEHLLGGLLLEDPQLFSLVNPGDAALIEKLRKVLPSDIGNLQSQSDDIFLPLSKAAREIVESANSEREQFKQTGTGTDHLLLAILRSETKPKGWLFARKVKRAREHEVLFTHGITVEGLVQLMQNGPATPQTRVVRKNISSSMVTMLHHVNVTVPPELEAAAKNFYGTVLGLQQVPKPAAARQTGAWYQIGDNQLHLSVDEEPRGPLSSRHICFNVSSLAEAEKRFRDAGVEIVPDPRPIPGTHRFYVRDPGGNQLEIVQQT